jgi:hypothetical protein
VAAPLILARNLKDAHAFAREELGLTRGHYRVVTGPSSISSVRGADLYLVPGHDQRFDRFAMRGALRYTRLNKIVVEEWRQGASVPDDLSPAGEQFMILTEEEATAFLLAMDAEPRVLPKLAELLNEPTVFEQAEEPVKRIRRRRCDDCGLLIDPSEVETHAAEHLPAG